MENQYLAIARASTKNIFCRHSSFYSLSSNNRSRIASYQWGFVTRGQLNASTVSFSRNHPTRIFDEMMRRTQGTTIWSAKHGNTDGPFRNSTVGKPHVLGSELSTAINKLGFLATRLATSSFTPEMRRKSCLTILTTRTHFHFLVFRFRVPISFDGTCKSSTPDLGFSVIWVADNYIMYEKRCHFKSRTGCLQCKQRKVKVRMFFFCLR